MYKDMFVDRTPPPSEHDLALRDKSLIAAEAVLKQALLDEAETRDSAAKGTGAHTAEVDEEIDPIDPNKRDGDTIDDSDMGTVGESDEDLEYVSESDEESDFDPGEWEPAFGPTGQQSTSEAPEQNMDADVGDEAKKSVPSAEAR
jgi:hypothetical protein